MTLAEAAQEAAHDDEQHRPQDGWSLRRDGHHLTVGERPFVLEIFAGSGRLTRHLRSAGFDAWAVDWRGGRLVPETPAILFVNLLAPDDQKVFARLLDHPALKYVHFAPPCGTASRARELRVNKFHHGPPQLRSEEYPLGLPTLGRDHPELVPRVESANTLYIMTANAGRILRDRKVPWSIENPRESYLWWIPQMRELIQNPDVKFVTFAHCAYGGQRPKQTGLLHFPAGAFDSLRAECPGVSATHTHASWDKTQGQFATALETVYPDMLCAAVTECVSRILDFKPQRPLPVIRARGDQTQRRHRPQREAAGRQPRGGRARQLLPEFRQVLSVRGSLSPADPRCRPGYTWTAGTFMGTEIPDKSKTVRAFFAGGAGPTSSSSPSPGSSCLSQPSSLSPGSCSTLSSVQRRPLPSRACLHRIGALGSDDVYIGREWRSKRGGCLAASKWANPFRVQDGGARAAVDKFEAYLRATPRLMNDLPELSGKRLVCHCAPMAACHADALIKVFVETSEDLEERECSLLIGVYREPDEFVNDALYLEHPYEAHYGSHALVTGLMRRMTSSTAEIITYRRAVLEKWRRKALELNEAEAHLHAELDPEVARIVGRKSLLLFRAMLEEVGFPKARELCDCMGRGFPIVGLFPVTGVFPSDSREAVMTQAELDAAAPDIRKEVLAMTRTSGDADQDAKLYQTTRDEVEKGWLLGPLAETELDRLGAWTLSRRFGVVQGSKLRAVDDFSVSGVNGALATHECIDPADVDHIAANARLHADALAVPPSLRSSSSPFSGALRHRDVEGDALLGRVFDIASAYKHLAVSPEHRRYSVISVYNPTAGRAEMYRQISLPFGAAAAVMAFNWVATALCAVLQTLFAVGATHFYDDFTVLERAAVAESVTEIIEGFFGLLGWDLKELPGFTAKPAPLGATIDLERAADGQIEVGNQPKRVDELIASINEIVRDGAVDAKLLEKLRGRLMFCRTLCFGRFAAVALRALNAACARAGSGSRAVGRSIRRSLQPDLEHALITLARVLRDSPSRILQVSYQEPLLLFTDGACEPGTDGRLEGSIGGVLLDPTDGTYRYFGGTLSESVMKSLTAESANPIAAVEVLAVWAALFLWEARVANRAVLGFVDNDPAKHALVRGSSPGADLAACVDAACSLEIRARSLCYWERVPSASNIADDPSRGVKPMRLAEFSAPARDLCSTLGPVPGSGRALVMGVRDRTMLAGMLPHA